MWPFFSPGAIASTRRFRAATCGTSSVTRGSGREAVPWSRIRRAGHGAVCDSLPSRERMKRRWRCLPWTRCENGVACLSIRRNRPCMQQPRCRLPAGFLMSSAAGHSPSTNSILGIAQKRQPGCTWSALSPMNCPPSVPGRQADALHQADKELSTPAVSHEGRTRTYTAGICRLALRSRQEVRKQQSGNH